MFIFEYAKRFYKMSKQGLFLVKNVKKQQNCGFFVNSQKIGMPFFEISIDKTNFLEYIVGRKR